MSEDGGRRLQLSFTTPATGQPACPDECCASPPATVVGTDHVGQQRRAVLTRRVRLLVAATISYNVIEAIIALAAGAVASSTALIGFGLDSVIEVASASAVAWQFSGKDPEARERQALKVIALSFFALAASHRHPFAVANVCRATTMIIYGART
jgi:hypothetical protein